ncbi:DNA gyrase subunit A, partial [Candidatus Hakubella thermalkaliphila]
DEVIRLIKTSKTVLQAKERLMKKFKLSEEQAQAILDMRLQRLTGLAREKIAQEHKELLNTIAYLKGVLADDRLVYEIIKKELRDLKKQFGDERKTEIAPDSSDLEIEDLIADEDVVISITHSGYIKRLPVDTYRRQKEVVEVSWEWISKRTILWNTSLSVPPTIIFFSSPTGARSIGLRSTSCPPAAGPLRARPSSISCPSVQRKK